MDLELGLQYAAPSRLVMYPSNGNERRSFARVADKKHNAGHYVNVIFESEPAALDQLKHRLAMNSEVFRVLFTQTPAPKPATA